MRYLYTVVAILLAFNLYGEVSFDIIRGDSEELVDIVFHKEDNVPMVLDKWLNIYSVNKDISYEYMTEDDIIYGFYISEEEFCFINNINQVGITIDRTIEYASWLLTSAGSDIGFVRSFYRLADNQIFLLSYNDKAKEYRKYSPTAEESVQLISPKEIDQATLNEYKKLLFESVEQNQDDKKEIVSWGKDKWATVLYQLSEDVFFIDRPLTKNSYLIDFSNPEELCRVEGFYDGKLVLQAIYLDMHHTQGVAFAEYEDKSITVRCNRQGIQELTIDYIEENPNGIFLYNPEIDLANISLDGYSPTE